MSPAQAAQQTNRTGDGKYATVPRIEGSVDLGLDPGPDAVEQAVARIVENPVRRAAVDAINDSDLTGLAAYDLSTETVTYLSETGARFTVHPSADGETVSVWAVDTSAHAETLSAYLGSQPQDEAARAARAAARIVNAVRATERADADIKDFSHAVVTVWRSAAVVNPTGKSRVTLDPSEGTFTIEGAERSMRGEQQKVILSGLDSADEDHDGSPSLSVVLLDHDIDDRPGEPQRFRLVREPSRVPGIHSDLYYREDTGKRLESWEARGLEAEIDQRAGLQDASGHLPRVLMEHTALRRAQRAQRTAGSED
ncbi:hypothetical protein ASF47_17875 [Nocardioides sp. Leaf285]|nr:hypothetical protein ASF47_17875 [Nocardioides sp. Leaf285]